MRYTPEWSPDGKRLAFSDKDGRLWVVTVADRKLVEVAHDRQGRIGDYTWSPGGDHLAFSLTDANSLRSIWIWSVADPENTKGRRVTGETFHETNPAWDPQGNYLYYLSSREFSPQFDDLDFNYAVDRTVGIYALALRKDVANPFPPESDEVTFVEKGGKDEKDSKDSKDKLPKTRIDFDGLASRVTRVPVPFDDWSDLAAGEGKLLYTKSTAGYLGRDPVAPAALHVFTLKDRKDAAIAEGVAHR
jgi:tricorn protease